MSSRGIKVALSDPASPRLLEPACLPLELNGLCGLVLQQGVLVCEGSSTVEARSGAWLGPGRGVRVGLGPGQGGVDQAKYGTYETPTTTDTAWWNTSYFRKNYSKWPV